MTKRIVFFLFIAIVSAFAHSAPTVWEQMQNQSSPAQRGVVKSVEILEKDVYFSIETKDAFGDKVVRKDQLCPVEITQDSEQSAAIFKAKIEMLQEARRSQKPIEFASKGASQPCVSVLRALDT